MGKEFWVRALAALGVVITAGAVHAGNLHISYYHGPSAVVEWSQGSAEPQVTAGPMETTAIRQGQVRYLTMSLRSNMRKGYDVTADMKRVGKLMGAAPKVALQALKRGQAVGEAHLSGTSKQSASLQFSGSALKRTRSRSATPDQVRMRVDTGAAQPRGQGLDVVTLTVAPR
jgi:hypothetical protein